MFYGSLTKTLDRNRRANGSQWERVKLPNIMNISRASMWKKKEVVRFLFHII